MKQSIIALATAALSVFITFGTADADEERVALKHAIIDVASQQQIQRGLTVFTEICMGCHSAKYVTYMDLMTYPEIGLSRKMVDELRDTHPLTTGMISDLSPADAKVSYGKVPPDLSVIVNARRGGADYVYSILTGFAHDPKGEVADGNWNRYFPGHRIAMPDPLSWLGHLDGETAELEQQAQDVTAFLTFISDPHQNSRRAIGKYVIVFLIIFTLVLYLLMKEVWKDVK